MSGVGRLARLVASTHAKRVRFPHPAPFLPSSIKAMRHAVNVSESGSIPEAAAISSLYTWGGTGLSIRRATSSILVGGAKTDPRAGSCTT